MPCDQTLVFDSSSLINTKTVISIDSQWWFFDGLLKRLQNGLIVVPKHVVRETSEGGWPDMPGAWAAGTYDQTPHPTDPQYEWVQQVMEQTPEVIEADAEMDKADPWVLALALELRSNGLNPVVVTDDHVDRPSKIALATACRSFDMPWIALSEALEWLEDHPS